MSTEPMNAETLKAGQELFARWMNTDSVKHSRAYVQWLLSHGSELLDAAEQHAALLAERDRLRDLARELFAAIDADVVTKADVDVYDRRVMNAKLALRQAVE